jgi:hypothetical protein
MADITGAYCAETDIERWIGTAIATTTSPTDTEAAAFAVARANVLSSLCAGLNYAVTPTTITAGSRLDYLMGEANAIGAALDYTVAQQFARQPSKSERAEHLQAMWEQYVGNASAELVGFIPSEIKMNLAAMASDQILSGDTAARTAEAAPTNEPIGFTMGSVF